MSDDALERAATAAATGLGDGADAGTVATLRRLVDTDPDPRVRAAALGALVRLDAAADSWHRAATDPDSTVRRRAAEWASEVAGGADVGQGLVALLDDPDPLVAEAAAGALGERADIGEEGVAAAVDALARVTVEHTDPLVREAAVAALGALGDPVALPSVLAALDDRAPVRRRAVLALAAFSGDEVEEALHRALEDRDWQVRQAAEDLLRPPS